MACSYKPFDLVVQPAKKQFKTRGLSKQTPADQELSFAAKVVGDGDKVLSDSPFIFHDSFGDMWAWAIDQRDTLFSTENSIAEIFGYLDEAITDEALKEAGLTREKLKKMFLRKKTIGLLQGLTVSDFTEFPTGKAEKGRKISAALGSIYGKQPGFKLEWAMTTNNNNPSQYGVPHFSRNSYLSSKQLQKVQGPSDLLLCAMFAYGVDFYRNPNKDINDSSKVLGVEAMRTSIMDYIASQALKEFKKTGDVKENFKVKIGNTECQVLKSKGHTLKPKVTYRCPAVVQKNPVIRSVKNADYGGIVKEDYKYIQVGKNLYYPKCSFTGSALEFYPGDHVDHNALPSYDKMIGHIASNLKDPELKRIIGRDASIITNPTVQSRNDYEKVASRCDDIYTKNISEISPVPTEAAPGPSGTSGTRNL